jgi:PepSY-associated TM region
MARPMLMQRFARWHIWLGWVVGLPVLMWTVTGLFMVARPIEEVRGNHLQIEAKEEALPAGSEIVLAIPQGKPVRSITTAMAGGKVITRLDYADGSLARFGEDGARLPPLGEQAARDLVKAEIAGGDKIASATLYAADKAPFDFRKAMPSWQVVLADGTHVYVGQHSGKIEAVRTRWWRAFDFMWGLHILDPQTREDTSHPLLISLAALSVIGALLGCILLFRRRRASVVAKGP